MNGTHSGPTERPLRLLAVIAHPRDVDRIGTTVTRWVEQGTEAWLVSCTSGDGHSDDAGADPLALAAAEEAELREAADRIGYASVTFLHRPQGAVVNDLALREGLVRQIRRHRPDAVATHDPRDIVSDDGIVNDVDHRECGTAAIDAVSPAAANAMAFPALVRSEGLEPHHVGRLYLFRGEDLERIDLRSQAVSRAPTPARGGR